MAAMRRAPFLLRRSKFSTAAAASVATTTTTTSEPNCISRVFSLIRSEQNPDRVISIIDSAAASIPRFHSHRPIYHFAVRTLAAAGRPDLVDRFLSSSAAAADTTNSEGFTARIISLYSSASLPDHAERFFNTLSKPHRTDKPLCALLTAFLAARRHDRVIETFNSAPKTLGVNPGVVAHNILLRSLAQSGKLDNARQMLDEMFSKGIEPNIVSYNAVLDGYLKKGDFDGFDEILGEMCQNGLDFNLFTYNCRIAGLCAKGKSFEAEELLDVMVVKEIRSNLATFNTLIENFCQEGNIGSALKVFKRMKSGNGKGGVAPNFDTYAVLIRTLVEKGDFGSAAEISQECLAMKYALPMEVVKGLIEGLMKNSKIDEVTTIVQKMKALLKAKGDDVEAWSKVEGALAL